jgi:hypothetical protein
VEEVGDAHDAPCHGRLDGSVESLAAARRAADKARLREAPLRLVNVWTAAVRSAGVRGRRERTLKVPPVPEPVKARGLAGSCAVR